MADLSSPQRKTSMTIHTKGLKILRESACCFGKHVGNTTWVNSAFCDLCGAAGGPDEQSPIALVLSRCSTSALTKKSCPLHGAWHRGLATWNSGAVNNACSLLRNSARYNTTVVSLLHGAGSDCGLTCRQGRGHRGAGHMESCVAAIAQNCARTKGPTRLLFGSSMLAWEYQISRLICLSELP